MTVDQTKEVCRDLWPFDHLATKRGSNNSLILSRIERKMYYILIYVYQKIYPKPSSNPHTIMKKYLKKIPNANTISL